MEETDFKAFGVSSAMIIKFSELLLYPQFAALGA